MNHLRLYMAAFLVLTLTAFSCDKEEELDVREARATLIWSGAYALDGCGFDVQLNEKLYKPVNEEDIADSFQNFTPATVEIKFVHLSKPIEFQCGMIPGSTKRDAIRILSIKAL